MKSKRTRRNRRARDDADTERAFVRELDVIYADVEAAYASHRCPGSTECCRFAVTGREPYVTTVEVAAVKRAIAARGGALRPNKQALPLLPKREEGICPLLDQQGLCAVYAARPLGCRTFWCDRADFDEPVRQKQLNTFVRRVRELAERHAPGAVQGRPLRRCLAD